MLLSITTPTVGGIDFVYLDVFITRDDLTANIECRWGLKDENLEEYYSDLVFLENTPYWDWKANGSPRATLIDMAKDAVETQISQSITITTPY